MDFWIRRFYSKGYYWDQKKKKLEWKLRLDGNNVSMLFFKLMLVLGLFEESFLLENAYYLWALSWQLTLKLFKKNQLCFNSICNFCYIQSLSISNDSNIDNINNNSNSSYWSFELSKNLSSSMFIPCGLSVCPTFLSGALSRALSGAFQTCSRKSLVIMKHMYHFCAFFTGINIQKAS